MHTVSSAFNRIIFWVPLLLWVPLLGEEKFLSLAQRLAELVGVNHRGVTQVDALVADQQSLGEVGLVHHGG